DIGGQGERAVAAGLDLARYFGELLGRAGQERHVGPLVGEREGDGPSQAPPRPRDDRDLTVESGGFHAVAKVPTPPAGVKFGGPQPTARPERACSLRLVRSWGSRALIGAADLGDG